MHDNARLDLQCEFCSENETKWNKMTLLKTGGIFTLLNEELDCVRARFLCVCVWVSEIDSMMMNIHDLIQVNIHVVVNDRSLLQKSPIKGTIFRKRDL